MNSYLTAAKKYRYKRRHIRYPALMVFTDQNVVSKIDHWRELAMRFSFLGISGKIFDSITVIPLIETALDDGCITTGEKDRFILVLKNLRLLSHGMDPRLGDLWLPFRKKTGFLTIWSVYLLDVFRQIPPEDEDTFKALLEVSTIFTIETIGDFLKVADLEDRMMCAIDKALR